MVLINVYKQHFIYIIIYQINCVSYSGLEMVKQILQDVERKDSG